MVVHTADSADVVVLLTESTDVGQIQGAFKLRRKEMSMAALIPGLEVQVEATYNSDQQLVASAVKFQGDDLERAQAIQAGLHQTDAQAQQNKAELEKQYAELRKQNAELGKQNAELGKQSAELGKQSTELKEQRDRIQTNKEAIDAAIARFGQLDDYYIFDEVTVLFGNGKTALEPQYKPQLLQLAQKAKTIEGYMIQVVGYASSSGSVAVNQKLSEDRADAVTNVLLQEGHIPLTNLLAPGAMGESHQTGGNQSSPEGEARNRRVVVRVLQNKGIAGVQGPHD